MFTRIQPAGNLFRYLTSAVDSMGKEREVPAMRIRGSLTSVVRMLQAQAPVGVSRRSRRKPGQRRARPSSDWIRHCQEHLVHLINCYIEPHAQILEHLPRIVRGTEDLLLAGLPREALAFVWYQHQKEFGTHPHGGLLRLTLPGGQAYVPNLNPELLLHFDRLVSRRFGFVDPLDPQGHRLFYAAWASAKPCNQAEITVACEAVQQAWAETPGEEFTHERVRQICDNNNLPLLAAPDETGRAQRLQAGAFAHLRVPLRRQTVVVASFDRRRAICFAGPACHHDFDPKLYVARLKHLENMVVQLQRDPASVYLRFERLLGDRITQQQQRWGKREAAVTLDHFAMLKEPSLAEADRAAIELEIKVATAIRDFERAKELQHQLDENGRSRPAAMANGLAMMNPLVRWSERAYPFATEQDLLRARALHDPALTMLLHPATAAADPFEDSLEDELLAVELAEFQLLEQQQQQQQQRGLAVRVSLAVSQWHSVEQERQQLRRQRALAIRISLAASVQLAQGRRQQQLKQRGLAIRVSLAASQVHVAERLPQRQRQQRELALQISHRASWQWEQFRWQQRQQQRECALKISLAATQLRLAEQQRQQQAQRNLTLEISGSASWQHEAFRFAAQERLEQFRSRGFKQTDEEIGIDESTESPNSAETPGQPKAEMEQKPEPKAQPQQKIKGGTGIRPPRFKKREDYDVAISALLATGASAVMVRQAELLKAERDRRFPLSPSPKPLEPPPPPPPANPPPPPANPPDAPGPLDMPSGPG